MAKRGTVGDEFGGSAEKPACFVVPAPWLGGELRAYRGIAQPFPAHAHDHYVVGFVRGGARTMVCNGESTSIEQGDLVVFNPGDIHGCVQKGSGPFAFDSLTFSREALDNAALRGPVVREPSATSAFESLFGLARETTTAVAPSEQELSSDVAECIQRLLAALRDDCPVASQPSGGDAVAQAFCQIRRLPEEHRSIGDFALGGGMSRYSFIRAYRRRYFITPAQHRLSLRVEEAARQLACGRAPAEVAMRTGFSDQAHLTRVFKQRMGVTPAAYGRMVSGGASADDCVFAGRAV